MKKILSILLVCLSIIYILSYFDVFAKAFRNDVYFLGTHGEMSYEELDNKTKLNSYTDDSPLITFMTPGHGGGYPNFIMENDKEKPQYNSSFLPEKLRNSSSSLTDLYIADVENGNDYGTKIKSGRLPGRNGDLIKFKMKKQTRIGNTDEYNETRITSLTVIPNHMLIILNSDRNKDGSHEALYQEINTVIDRISYNIFTLSNKVPRVNLIGYSRGGMPNMIYAANHPYNVDSMFSLDTPYTGSKLGSNSLIQGAGKDVFESASGIDLWMLIRKKKFA